MWCGILVNTSHFKWKRNTFQQLKEYFNTPQNLFAAVNIGFWVRRGKVCSIFATQPTYVINQGCPSMVLESISKLCRRLKRTILIIGINWVGGGRHLKQGGKRLSRTGLGHLWWRTYVGCVEKIEGRCTDSPPCTPFLGHFLYSNMFYAALLV